VAVAALFGAVLLTNPFLRDTGLGEFITVRITPLNVVLLCLFLVIWPLIFSIFGLYDPAQITTPRVEATRVLGAYTIITLTSLALLFTGEGDAYRLSTAAVFFVAASGGTLALRHASRFLIALRGGSMPRHILIVGTGPRAYNLYRSLLADSRAGQEVVGFVDSSDVGVDVADEVRERILGTLDDLERILLEYRVDEVRIALPIRSCYGRIQDTIATCERIGIESRLPADLFQFSLARPEYEPSSSAPVIALKVVQDDIRLIVKRLIDVVFAGAGLILLSPLLLIIALLIKLTSPGPVFFAQDRYGYNRRLFRMYKFRTMTVGAEAMQEQLEHLNEARGPVFKIRDDPRITPIGRFLRRTSLDELPQLFNVLKGDMSLVGPRPLPKRDVNHFQDAWLMRRFSVLPGLTCLWQVSGRSNLGFDDWVTLDLAYIDRWSLRLDFLILLRTIPAVFKGTGAA